MDARRIHELNLRVEQTIRPIHICQTTGSFFQIIHRSTNVPRLDLIRCHGNAVPHTVTRIHVYKTTRNMFKPSICGVYYSVSCRTDLLAKVKTFTNVGGRRLASFQMCCDNDLITLVKWAFQFRPIKIKTELVY